MTSWSSIFEDIVIARQTARSDAVQSTIACDGLEWDEMLGEIQKEKFGERRMRRLMEARELEDDLWKYVDIVEKRLAEEKWVKRKLEMERLIKEKEQLERNRSVAKG